MLVLLQTDILASILHIRESLKLVGVLEVDEALTADAFDRRDPVLAGL